MSNLLPGERIDELQRNGYRIIQNPEKFCFGMDAVLLSGFARAKKHENCLDLGCGNGIIPILMEAKTAGNHFTGLEIQPGSADMARRSVALNDLQDRIDIVEGDIKDASKIFGASSFHVVTTNPPYMTAQHGLTNLHEAKTIARHEVLCNLEDIIRETFGTGGTFLYGTPPVPSCRNHFSYGTVSDRTEADASGISLCGSGAEYGADRGSAGWKKPDDRRKTIDRIQRTGKIYG